MPYGRRLHGVSKGKALQQIAKLFVTRLDCCASRLRHVGRGRATPREQRVQARCNAVSKVKTMHLRAQGARLSRRGRLRVHAASRPPDGETGVQSSSNWDSVTAKLVSAATVVFFFLLVPQIVKNAVNLLNGDVAALTAIAWVVSGNCSPSFPCSAVCGKPIHLKATSPCGGLILWYYSLIHYRVHVKPAFSGIHLSSFGKHNAAELLSGARRGRRRTYTGCGCPYKCRHPLSGLENTQSICSSSNCAEQVLSWDLNADSE